jgi:hypothetical protein
VIISTNQIKLPGYVIISTNQIKLPGVSVKFHTFNFYLRRYKIGVDIKLINEILFNLQKSTSLGQLVIKFRKIKRKKRLHSSKVRERTTWISTSEHLFNLKVSFYI